jgi:hypothetical protein
MQASMTEKSAESKSAKVARTAAVVREERLKAALKANMARRKAQAKTRTKKGPDQG